MRKKIFFLLLILFFSFFLSPLVFASENTTNVTNAIESRIVENRGYDESTDSYNIYYKFYGSKGLREGTVPISKDLYEKDHWFLYDNGISAPLVYYFNSDTITFTSAKRSGTYNHYFYQNGSWSWYCDYEYDLKERPIENIIFCKDLFLYFSYNSTSYSLTSVLDYYYLDLPTIQYLEGKGLRIKLNDFYSFTDVVGVSEVSRSLTSVKVSATDLSTGSSIGIYNNILADRDVQGDDGNYYIDLLFNDNNFLNLNTRTCDYFISFTFNLKSTKYLPGESSYLNTTSLCSPSIYVKYSYNADTKSGILIEVDENGNEIDHGGGGDDPTPTATPDKTEEAINNQTQKIEEQTEAIKEQTEVSKNIFQQIIELPGKIVELLVEAIKSIFIPHEGFFNEWLDDLNSYFGETFGILYYPFQVLIDFLNRVSGLSSSGTAIIHIPEFSFNFMGYQVNIIQSYDFDFNSILINDTYKNLHNIYLMVVDVILWLGLIYLVKKLSHSIFGGIRDDDIQLSSESIDNDNAGTVSGSIYKPPKHMK